MLLHLGVCDVNPSILIGAIASVTGESCHI